MDTSNGGKSFSCSVSLAKPLTPEAASMHAGLLRLPAVAIILATATLPASLHG